MGADPVSAPTIVGSQSETYRVCAAEKPSCHVLTLTSRGKITGKAARTGVVPAASKLEARGMQDE